MRLKRFTATVAAMLFVVVFFTSDVWAQKIYLLVSADTAPYEKGRNIGPANRASMSLLENAFRQNVPAKQLVPYGENSYENEEGQSVKIDSPWLGPNVLDNSKNMEEKLLKAISSCPAGSNDTIVFCYFGHGGYVNGEHHLAMPNDGPLVRRKRLSRALQAKGCRLAVLMTESCSSVPGDMLAEFAEPCAIPAATISPLFDSLFIKSRGLADFNSSTKPEFGMAPPFGGLMILAMTSVCEPCRNGNQITFKPTESGYGIFWQFKNQRLSWSKFKSHLMKKEGEIFKEIFPNGIPHKKGSWVQKTQTPHFFSLPNGNGYRQHRCFLKRLLARLHCKHRRCHCRRTSQIRVGCCR